jgi:hypothetical protein
VRNGKDHGAIVSLLIKRSQVTCTALRVSLILLSLTGRGRADEAKNDRLLTNVDMTHASLPTVTRTSDGPIATCTEFTEIRFALGMTITTCTRCTVVFLFLQWQLPAWLRAPTEKNISCLWNRLILLSREVFCSLSCHATSAAVHVTTTS